mmetsp:Transcript_9829/g.17888  ORF Transcript_9829/g.17888 Transcript_9829/m.17888 type:complete len:139 (+) Transcript_9829:2327-2743(+)
MNDAASDDDTCNDDASDFSNDDAFDSDNDSDSNDDSDDDSDDNLDNFISDSTSLQVSASLRKCTLKDKDVSDLESMLHTFFGNENGEATLPVRVVEVRHDGGSTVDSFSEAEVDVNDLNDGTIQREKTPWRDIVHRAR